ncbi:MAG: tetratricopeptide repeat protein [Myxococcales bacterium]|nr:tetratricopeptide repeat protein [Myxococcales bacterium]
MVAEDPDNELALFSLGQVLFERSNYAAAQEAFGRACLLQPDLMMAHLRRGECLVRLKRLVEAQKCLESARDLAIAQNHTGPRGDADDLLEEIADELD